MNLNKPHKDIKINDDSGFTLIEVLIAVAIFAIGFLAVGLMQTNALTTTNSARRTTEAMALAENQAEWLRAVPFYDKVAGNPFVIHPDLAPASAAAPREDNVAGPFFVRWTVIYDQPLPANTMVVNNAGNPVTRSMTIRVWVTRDTDPPDEVQAEIEFVKFPGQLNL